MICPLPLRVGNESMPESTVIETLPMEQVNQALDRLRAGEAHYRIVLTR